MSVLFLTTTFLISCSDEDDENGNELITQPPIAQPPTGYGTPSLKLGRYISDCKKTSNASRSEKTIIVIFPFKSDIEST